MILGNTVRFTAYTLGQGILPGLYDTLQGKRVAVISGEKSWEAAGHKLPKLDICCHIKYGTECTMEAIGTSAEACGEAGADVILGVGGGKALDVAKAAGQLTGLAVYTVPTIAATCAAVTALSVVYHEGGALDRFWLLDEPPKQAFLDTALLASAPARYFRAGMVDAMAKHLECTFSSRMDKVNFTTRLGREISNTIYEPLLRVGARAYEDCVRQEATDSLEAALQSAIISTGYVSLLVDEQYNGAVAHSICYGLTALPGVEGRILHGELVGYGCLVQLALDGQAERLEKLRAFLRTLGSPVTLAEMEIVSDEATLGNVLDTALSSPDMEHLPFVVTKEMLMRAIETVEGRMSRQEI